MTRVVSDIGRYATVPEWLLDTGVSAQAIRLFAVLAAKYADRDTDLAHPSRDRLAQDIQASLDTVDRALKELTGCGALRITRRTTGEHGRESNLYRLRFARPGGLRTSADSPAEVSRTGAANVSRTVSRTGAAQSISDPESDDPESSPPPFPPVVPPNGTAQYVFSTNPEPESLEWWNGLDLGGPRRVRDGLHSILTAGKRGAPGYDPLTLQDVQDALDEFGPRATRAAVAQALIRAADHRAAAQAKKMRAYFWTWLRKDFPPPRGVREKPVGSGRMARDPRYEHLIRQ